MLLIIILCDILYVLFKTYFWNSSKKKYIYLLCNERKIITEYAYKYVDFSVTIESTTYKYKCIQAIIFILFCYVGRKENNH